MKQNKLLICLFIITTLSACQGANKHLKEDINFIGSAPRAPGDEHHKASLEYCANTFESLGYQVTYQTSDTFTNVIGTKPGKDEKTLLISAHYDSLPNCNGADDNASGVAGLLSIARLLAEEDYQHTLELVCFDLEESGLIGSQAYVSGLAEHDIFLQVNLEMIAYHSKEVNSQSFPKDFKQLYPNITTQLLAKENTGDFIALIHDQKAIQYLPSMVAAAQNTHLPTMRIPVDTTKTIPVDFTRSDHAPFWAKGIPAIQITDTANFRNPNYHCENNTSDNIDALDLDFAYQVVNMVTESSKLFLNSTHK